MEEGASVQPYELPDLDYAYLADYAKVDDSGLLTTVGASFTILRVSELPVAHHLYVAGRVRMPEDVMELGMRAMISGPDPDTPELSVDFLVDGSSATPYEGRKGAMFVTSFLHPVMSPGLHVVRLYLEGQEVRVLAFNVGFLQDGPA